jgi:hypothetical protein
MRFEPVPAEFVLAAACCRPAGEERDSAVRAAAGVDWRRFERAAIRHRIEGLAYAALTSAGVTPCEEVADSLRRTAGLIAIAGLEMAAETLRLQTLFDRAGIGNLVLKGATLDILAWSRVGAKRSWDIDLLVTANDADDARRLLEQQGYALHTPADSRPGAFERWVTLSKEAVFRHRDRDFVVELHWRATDVATLLSALSAESSAQSVALSASIALRTFADDELFAYLCVHGTSHAWSRLKWLADLGALMARRDEDERERLYRRAIELRAGHCPATAMLLCERLLDVPLPSGCAAEILADRKAARLAGLALEALIGGDGAQIADRPLASERILVSHFLFADGGRFLLAEWRRQWVSIADHMQFKLPRRWSFVYGLLRGPLFVERRLRRTLRRP